MIRRIRIKTKTQNLFLIAISVVLSAVMALSAYFDFSTNKDIVVFKETKTLTEKTNNVSDSLARYFGTSFDSLGELYYDNNIKNAIKHKNTRAYSNYKKFAVGSIRDYVILKDYKNFMLFDSDFGVISSFLRTMTISEYEFKNLKERLEDYKQRQVIFQKLNGKDAIIFILKIDYGLNNSVYAVLIEDLEKYSQGLADYETGAFEFFAISRSLDYVNTLIKLKGPNSYSYFNQQSDTMIKYNRVFAKGFNAKGQEVISKLKDLSEHQNIFILGLLKPEYVENSVNDRASEIKSEYIKKFAWIGLIVLLTIIVLISGINIQMEYLNLVKSIKKSFVKAEDENETAKMSRRVKKQAYSYIDKDASISGSISKVYNSLKKMTPEDIKNLSIKNSLSKENIRLVYQPVVDTEHMQSQFCEVFLRLLNYYGEELMPSEFIPVLSHFNMLDNLDEMMLEKIIRKIETLQVTDPEAKISLNISSGAFESFKFLDKIKTELQTGNMNANNVILELPAVDILEKRENSLFVKGLGEMGVDFTISVDVLDEEISEKLLEHNIKYVRINMSDFADVLENKIKQEKLKAILANSKKYNFKLIAERIETEVMFKLAKSLGIELLQGYYISKPKKYYTHK